jgi:hypothetical protein
MKQGEVASNRSWNQRLVPLALILAACGGDADRQNETPADSGVTNEQQLQQQGGMRGYPATDPSAKPGTLGEPGVGEKVAVILTEWSVSLSRDSIGAGPAIFVIENKGTRTHRVEIRNEHFGRWNTVPIAPGGSAELSMPLTYADFEVFCPMEDVAGNHREKGMLATLRVR